MTDESMEIEVFIKVAEAFGWEVTLQVKDHEMDVTSFSETTKKYILMRSELELDMRRIGEHVSFRDENMTKVLAKGYREMLR